MSQTTVPYNHRAVEQKWRKVWEDKPINVNDGKKPKYYCLDMFPYPSGNGLHVGHWRGYVISDVWSRYKLMHGYYVIHPMGWDAFGLPAENYAIKMGVHPEKSTAENIRNIKRQIQEIAAIYDWDMEVNTTDPEFYKWTQWIFVKMFKAGLAYEKEMPINWCPSCKTGLANEEVVNGKCERCGADVTKKNLKQWMLKITKYADRLLADLDKLDWPEKVKKMQTDWIGKSNGAEVNFKVDGSDKEITVYTTRPDTLHGATFMVLAPEHALAKELATDETRAAVEDYIYQSSLKSSVDRLQDKEKTGVFTGSYAINPLNGAKVPIWLSDYVLADYGTGAIMCVPAHDDRDFEFAKKFNIPIIQVIAKDGKEIENMTEAYTEAKGIMINSGDWNGMESSVLKKEAPEMIEKMGFGKKTTNYKLRDWVFSRQRYWGEPFPVYYDADGMPQMLPVDKLPLELPEVDKFLPTETGEPPLGHAVKWAWDTVKQEVTEVSKIDNKTIFPLELCTMPGFAGSSAYYLRYMDPRNDQALVAKDVDEYWRNVDLYIGGTEHATGHLIYSRFWNKFLFDLGIVCEEEPFKKLINQGMIQGRSNFVYRINGTNKFVSLNLKDQYEVTPIHVDVNIVSNDILDIEAFKNWRPEYNDAEFVLEDGKYICGWAVEKMSKSMFNVVNPDMIVEKYGADTLRLYEMFLGPLEQSKPWDTNGIDGVHRFLKKLWGLFFGNTDTLQITDAEPTADELKSLHKLIKKVTYDIEHFSYNTSISAFMICVNELSSLKCNKRAILEQLIVLLAPFAPHTAEELWHTCGHNTTVCDAEWPVYNEEYLKENSLTYAISFNGKARFSMELPADMPREEIEKAALAHENSAKWMEGKTPKKIIVVPGKIVNIVI